MDNCQIIAAMEARHAAERATGDVREKLRAAMTATVNHWLLRTEEDRLRAAVAGTVLAFGENSTEAEQLTRELRLLHALFGGHTSEIVAAAEEGFQAVGILTLWKEICERAPEKQSRH